MRGRSFPTSTVRCPWEACLAWPSASLNAIGDYGGDAGLKIYTDQIMDHFTHVHGRHTLKAGIDVGRYRFSGIATAFGSGSGLTGDAAFGSFNFTGRYTSPVAAAQAPHAFADFLLGYPASTGRASAAPPYLSSFWRYAGLRAGRLAGVAPPDAQLRRSLHDPDHL